MKSKIYTRITMAVCAMFMFSYVAFSQTTIEIQIVDGADDAEEYLAELEPEGPLGGVDLTSSDLELPFDHEPQVIGMIFRDVQIPIGANVTHAHVQFTVDVVKPGTTDAEVTLTVDGAAEANTSAPILEELFNISSRARTTANVTWMPGPSVNEGDRTENERTPDLSAVVNEIIALPGWAPGNNIMIRVWGDPAQTEDINREMESYDGDAAQAPSLVVVFEEGTGVNPNSAELSNLIYPNPAEGTVNIDNPSGGNFGYKIHDISGKLVARRMDLSGTTTMVDISEFARGVYFVDVISERSSQTLKLIVE